MRRQRLGAFSRAVPEVDNLIIRVAPIHGVDIIEIQQLPLRRMQKAHVIAGGITIRNYYSIELKHVGGNAKRTKISGLILALEQHGIAGMKIQIGVLVQLQSARHLFLVATILHLLRGHRMMHEFRRPLV